VPSLGFAALRRVAIAPRFDGYPPEARDIIEICFRPSLRKRREILNGSGGISCAAVAGFLSSGMPIDTSAAHTFVRRSDLFTDVPHAAVERVLTDLEVFDVAAGDHVLLEGRVGPQTHGPDLYILVEGQLVATRALPDGRIQRLSSMGPGEFFGELSLVDEGVRSATVTAVTTATVARIPGVAVERLIAEAPIVIRSIAGMLARRLRAADQARLVAQLNEERLSVIGRAAAMLVHDLKNPLGVIRNASALIEEGIAEPGQWARRSRNAADFMLAMVKDLLDFAKGERNYSRVPVRAADLVDDVESFGLAPLEAAGAVRIRRIVKGDASLIGDRQALSRALLNIVKNAAEAMPGGGELTFESIADESGIRFTISDQGPGIPDAILPSLFEPFSTYGKSTGTGLGMAMTKAAIEAHGGHITVDSAPGQGSCFRVVLSGQRSRGPRD